jgi:protein kinase C substrate 80K-H
MYVNDGVCDYDLCCDGSEEFSGVGGVKCSNRCAEIGKEYLRVEEERKKGKERAAKRRRALIKEAKELRRKVESTVASLKDEIAGLVVKRDELQRKFEDVERSEKGKVVGAEGDGGKLGVLVGLSKKRVSELRETLEKVKDQRDDLQEKVDELEGILRKFKDEYNPNFNDEGVKQAVHAWEDYAASLEKEVKVGMEESELTEILKADSDTSGVNWAEFETDDAADTDICKPSISASASLACTAPILTWPSIQPRGLPASLPARLPTPEAEQPAYMAYRERHAGRQPLWPWRVPPRRRRSRSLRSPAQRCILPGDLVGK